MPLWIERLKQTPWCAIAARLPELTNAIASHGDDLLYRSKKRGDTAKAFNALAESIAALSFAPGGVSAFGSHWESRHPEQSTSDMTICRTRGEQPPSARSYAQHNAAREGNEDESE